MLLSPVQFNRTVKISSGFAGIVVLSEFQERYSGQMEMNADPKRKSYQRDRRILRAGLSSLNEGQQIEFEIEDNRGKSSAVNLRLK